MTGPQRSKPKQSRQQNSAPYNRPLPITSGSSRAKVSDTTSSDDDSSSLPTISRQITRMVAMFWSPRAMLNAYLDLQQAIEDGSEETLCATASPVDKLHHDVCDEMGRIQPEFFELLDGKDRDSRRQVRKDLSDGQSGAKAEDNGKVKNAIVHWREWSPPLKNEPKTTRGLSHPECARLLAPITVDWDDEEERRQFTECDNPPMISSHWPRALYLGDNGDPSQPSKGLLQGELLVNTVKAILESPSSVLPSTSARPNVVKQGRKGVAHKYHLGEMTPSFLAYAAVVLRFALSSEYYFNDTGGTFNYIDFYTQIRHYLESPKYEKTNKILLAWWNKKIFPNSVRAYNTNAGVDEVTGMLSLLDAEMEHEQEQGSEDED